MVEIRAVLVVTVVVWLTWSPVKEGRYGTSIVPSVYTFYNFVRQTNPVILMLQTTDIVLEKRILENGLNGYQVPVMLSTIMFRFGEMDCSYIAKQITRTFIRNPSIFATASFLACYDA